MIAQIKGISLLITVFEVSAYYFRNLRLHIKENIVRDLMTSASAQEELEAEFAQLKADRDTLRQIFPAGVNRVTILSQGVAIGCCL